MYYRNLKSNWYTADVCDYIYNSLEGAKKWIAPTYQAKCEREAFEAAFEKCQKICKDNDMKVESMLLHLASFKLESFPKQPFFSKARWIYDPAEAHTAAIDYAIDLVDGISERFLP